MENAKHKFTDWIRKKAREDSALAYLIQFAYHFFANNYVQAITALIGTLIIGVMIENAYYGIWFKVTITAYVSATLLSAWANQHIRQKIHDTKTFQSALFGLSTALRSFAITFQKTAKDLRNADMNESTKKFILKKDINFQVAAFAVCSALRDMLSQKAEKDDVYITVYQKINDSGNAPYCRMIAYSENHEVTSYGNKYPILPEHKHQFGQIEYHTYVFAKELKEVSSFHTPELVKDAFCYHDSCEEREKAIQQYICIPISPAGLGVTFLLQVDTNTPNRFGSTKTAVEEFAKNTIYPYAQILHMMYELCRVIGQLTVK